MKSATGKAVTIILACLSLICLTTGGILAYQNHKAGHKKQQQLNSLLKQHKELTLQIKAAVKEANDEMVRISSELNKPALEQPEDLGERAEKQKLQLAEIDKKIALLENIKNQIQNLDPEAAAALENQTAEN